MTLRGMVSYKIKQIIENSKIISFFADLNKNLLLYFYNSKIYRFFTKINSFFRDISKNIDKSIIIRSSRKMLKNITISDIGLFITLVILFNTLAMIVLKKEIDIFSITARIFFFLLGMFLIFRKSKQ